VVKAIHEVNPNFISSQLDAVFEDIGVDAVKIGMLHNPAVINIVAERLKHYAVRKIVVDPVMISKSGTRLLEEDAVHALKIQLFPLALVITPNLFEASALLEKKVRNKLQMEKAAKELLGYGSASVIIKGGHLEDNSNADCLAIRRGNGADTFQIHWYKGPTTDTRNTHGTGCTFSSAICAFLARENEIEVAAEKAKDYISQAIEFGAQYRLGNGHGPVHHFYAWWGAKT
jgi:hydroxymethylpyrimidine/phosphomethylpyrimidine kinase